MGSATRVCTWACLCTSLFAASYQQPYRIADFEGARGLENWRFHSNLDSPSAGDLKLGPGHREQGAILNYKLPCDPNTRCGAYAEALWTPPSSLPKRHDPAVSLWVRVPPEVEAALAVKDSSGEMLRFPIHATIEHPRSGSWQYAVIPLTPKNGRGIKGRPVEIGISVYARTRSSVEGSVSFDDVQWREASERFHIGNAETEALPPLAPRLGVNIHLLDDDKSLDLAHAAGFGFVRMDMLWTNVERGGRYRFFAYDRLLRSLEARGMGVLWILDYGHPDHGGSPPRKREDIAAFGRFAEAAAAHFKGRNVRYEVWNEPDTRQFWTPSPSASEYGALLREAVAAIHRGDPSAKISSGGVSRFDVEFLSRAIDKNLAASLTAVGIHPYPKSSPESVAQDLSELRDWLAGAFGDRLEVWDTEWGYSSTNASKKKGREKQAVLAVREVLTVWALGFPLAVWYDLRDDGTDPANQEHNYGLLDSDGNEKDAMKAIHNLMTLINSHKNARMIPDPPFGIHALRFDGALIVWTDQPGRRTVEFPKPISATDVLGRALKSKSKFDIDENSPIIVFYDP